MKTNALCLVLAIVAVAMGLLIAWLFIRLAASHDRNSELMQQFARRPEDDWRM